MIPGDISPRRSLRYPEVETDPSTTFLFGLYDFDTEIPNHDGLNIHPRRSFFLMILYHDDPYQHIRLVTLLTEPLRTLGIHTA